MLVTSDQSHTRQTAWYGADYPSHFTSWQCWFMVACIASRLYSGSSFALIVQQFDPRGEIPVAVRDALYELDYYSSLMLWEVQRSLVRQLVGEENP